uniref:ShKT domain-containing protein n=1 Tax=Steinernema glaseri TaxID=37863 RepID=A0A1I7ZI74_9BILA
MCDATVHGRFTGFIGFVEAESESERRRRGDAADDGSCTHDPTMTRRPHRRRFTRAERTGFAAAARSHSEGSRMAARASEVNKFRRPSAAAVSPFRRPRHHYEMNPVMMLLFFLATIALGPVTAVSHSTDCEDADPNCRDWVTADMDMCKTTEYITRSCKRSCGLCAGLPRSMFSTTYFKLKLTTIMNNVT